LSQFHNFLWGASKNGVEIFDKPESHIHHNVTNLVPTIIPSLIVDPNKVFQEFIVGVEEVLPLMCLPVAVGDELFLAKRKDRKGYSIFFKAKKPGTTNKITLMLKKSSAYPDSVTSEEEGFTIATAFAGLAGGREPWNGYFFEEGLSEDEQEKRSIELASSKKYWLSNAFVFDKKEFSLDKDFEPVAFGEKTFFGK
jgi:hypothetical protein